uniref:Glycosyltransferase n=1 Tax=Cyanothece sp. (strain PCC 7425 / ATCC 29141) TaxID=395961 RepID=B8HVI6_CYAP4
MIVQDSVCVLLFVKVPQPGRVKTRLAEAIGIDHATQLYQTFGLDLLNLLRQLPADLLIYYTPVGAEATLQAWLGREWPYYAQVGEDLGARLTAAFSHAFALGYQRAIVLGSDSPDIPLAYLQEALEVLQHHQVAIGPTRDGGYYTIGFSAANFLPQAFSGIAWSTETVFDRTLERLKAHTAVHILPPWYDVDTLADLEQLEQETGGSAAVQTRQYLSQYRQEIFNQPSGQASLQATETSTATA